ncbi:MAG: type II toxin-antitoxin system PemK/MazF family toxin [Proteobacteria bacterium]|nr:type II toxin-antitoxin system PemK/MazF family toxin [Pseudomonadota bacterium]
MKRGEIWSIGGGPDYLGKPRPAVIIQEDAFDATASLAVCAFTTDPTDAPLIRLLVRPTEHYGLERESRFMVDKVTTVSKGKVAYRIGELDDADLVRLNRALVVFLGLAGAP